MFDFHFESVLAMYKTQKMIFESLCWSSWKANNLSRTFFLSHEKIWHEFKIDKKGPKWKLSAHEWGVCFFLSSSIVVTDFFRVPVSRPAKPESFFSTFGNFSEHITHWKNFQILIYKTFKIFYLGKSALFTNFPKSSNLICH